MIVCSCNVLSDRDIRTACSAAQAGPRTPGQVYGCLGCSAQCGRCARTIKSLLNEALQVAAGERPVAGEELAAIEPVASCGCASAETCACSAAV